jgi:hypothetical protein
MWGIKGRTSSNLFEEEEFSGDGQPSRYDVRVVKNDYPVMTAVIRTHADESSRL